MIPKEIGHVVKFKDGIVGLFKRGWWEIPEIMGASCMGLTGTALAIYGGMRYLKAEGDKREYKSVYYIVREGDPRAANIRNPVFTEYPDPNDKTAKMTC